MAVKTNIGIFGIGAIGSTVAYELSKNVNNKLYYFSRTEKTSINLIVDDKEISKAITCITKISIPYNLDWLVICLKEYQYKGAENALKTLICQNTKIAVIRNGINLKESVLSYTTENNILECIIDCPVQPIKNGFYKQYRTPVITVPKNELAQIFSNLFKENSKIVNRVKDFNSASWSKLIESSAIGAILCLTRETCKVFKKPELLNLYRQLVKEGISVAQSEGAKFPIDFEEILIKKLKTYDPNKGSSMLTDRLNGNPIELNAKNGAITKVSRKNKIPTPKHDLMCALINPLKA